MFLSEPGMASNAGFNQITFQWQVVGRPLLICVGGGISVVMKTLILIK